MRAVILIAFLMQVHGKELETSEINELANKMINQLSDRVFKALPLEDTDLDSSTLAKPGQVAMPKARLNALSPAQSVLLGGRTGPVSNAMQREEATLASESGRRSLLASMAMMAPLVAIAGEAMAEDNAYIAELEKLSKDNKAKNEKARNDVHDWNGRRFSIDTFKDPKLATVPDDMNAMPFIEKVPGKVAADLDVLKRTQSGTYTR
jgi:hypothetical protein